jgi:hypothetical protein
MTALAKHPEQRHQSMSAFSQAILDTPEGRMLGGASVSMIPDVPASQFAASPSSHATAAQFGNAQPAVTSAQFGAQQPPPPLQGAPDRSRATTPLSEVQGAQDIARAQTQLGAETAAPTHPPQKRSGALAAVIAIVTLGLLGGGGAIALFAMKRGPEPVASAEPAAKPPPPEPSQAVPPSTPATVASAPPAASASAAPSASIKLSVVTDPAGAVITKDGFQVCDTTPCEVMAAPSETLQLEARKGALRGTAKVLAQRDQKIEIKLKGAPSGKSADKGSGEKPCLRERMQGDIKIVEVVPCPK